MKVGSVPVTVGSVLMTVESVPVECWTEVLVQVVARHWERELLALLHWVSQGVMEESHTLIRKYICQLFSDHVHICIRQEDACGYSRYMKQRMN